MSGAQSKQPLEQKDGLQNDPEAHLHQKPQTPQGGGITSVSMLWIREQRPGGSFQLVRRKGAGNQGK